MQAIYQHRGCYSCACHDSMAEVVQQDDHLFKSEFDPHSDTTVICLLLSTPTHPDTVLHHHKLPDTVFQRHNCATSSCQHVYCASSCSIRSSGSTNGGALVRPPTPNCNTVFSHACMFCVTTRKQVQLHTDEETSSTSSCKHVQKVICKNELCFVVFGYGHLCQTW